MAFHDPVDPLVIGRRQGKPGQFAVHQHDDPRISVARAFIHEASDHWQQCLATGLQLRPARIAHAANRFLQVGARNAQRLRNPPHREPPFRCDRSRKVRLFYSALSSASLRISISMVLRPSSRLRTRIRSSSLRPSKLCSLSSGWTLRHSHIFFVHVDFGLEE